MPPVRVVTLAVVRLVLPVHDYTNTVLLVLLCLLYNLFIDSWQLRFLLVLLVLRQVFFNLLKPCDFSLIALKTIQSPLLGILLEYKENQNYQVTIKVVKVAMTLLWAMVDTHPEQVKCYVV